jgi:hypothetical protein
MVQGKPRLKYRAAEVIAAADTCDAARSLSNMRLLSAEVPLLPLKACDRPATCNCIYRRFDDRRRAHPRRVSHAIAQRGVEQRRGRGRRDNDYA